MDDLNQEILDLRSRVDALENYITTERSSKPVYPTQRTMNAPVPDSDYEDYMEARVTALETHVGIKPPVPAMHSECTFNMSNSTGLCTNCGEASDHEMHRLVS